MKKWAKFLCCFVFLGTFLVCGLAGCGTVSNIKNIDNELIYNGNAASLVKTSDDNFLYFGNAFASTAPTSGKEYSESKKFSYLARVNATNLEAKNAYFSPKKVETVSEEVASYDDSFMFVLGQNIYYATPNKQMVNVDGEAAYHYEYTCFYKSSLNGDKKKKLYTTTGEVSQIEVLKNENKYYLVMLAGENLISINLSNDKVQILATDVTSVALPKTYKKDVDGSTTDWNGQIYFTTAFNNEGNSGASRSIVKKISVSAKNSDDAEEIFVSYSTLTFVSRERDVVFFTDTVENQQAAVYLVDLTNANDKNAFLSTSEQRKKVYEGDSVSASTVTDLHLVTMKTYDGENSQTLVLGYVFKANSTWRYYTKAGKSGAINFSQDLSSATALLVSGRRMFFATESGLFRADLSKVFGGVSTDIKVEQFVSMTDISNTAAFAFDGKNLYFYAKLQEIPEDLKDKDENSDEEQIEETDDNYYLYRANVDGSEIDSSDSDDKGKFELLGKTVIKSRRTK